MGADLSPARLIDAYSQGIFPWYNDGQPVLWWSPDPRMVLKPEEVHISKSMRKVLRDAKFKVTYNTHFLDVILNCCNASSARLRRPNSNAAAMLMALASPMPLNCINCLMLNLTCFSEP